MPCHLLFSQSHSSSRLPLSRHRTCSTSLTAGPGLGLAAADAFDMAGTWHEVHGDD